MDTANLAIPGEKDCIELLDKYHTPHHIVLHSRKVWDVAKVLGEGMLRGEYPLDLGLLRASCLLHDIGKYPCLLDGSRFHDVRGEEILQEEGFPEVARLVAQHVILRGTKDDPVREEHVLFYADKRVVHDQLVTLEDRFIYLEETYGKNLKASERLLVMKQETVRLENAIFKLVDFGPEDIEALL
jgi:uncharacterized protein